MSIQLHIQADTPDQFLAYVGVLARTGALAVQVAQPSLVTDQVGTMCPAPQTSATEDVTADIAAEAASLPQEAAPLAPKRGRGRPKKDTQAAQEPAEAASGLGQADEDPFGAAPAPEAETERDPAVDHGLALELLRNAYDRPGAAAQANLILTHFNVAKFTLIPKDKGTELLALARKLDAETTASAVL